MQPVDKALDGQALSLAPECWRRGVILHELMHLLGFFHEHSRWDRDLFVELNFENIQRGDPKVSNRYYFLFTNILSLSDKLRQFDRRKRSQIDEMGRYDLSEFSITRKIN